MNLLVELLTAHVKTGAGEYLRRVLFELLQCVKHEQSSDIKIYALYDSVEGIAYDDLSEKILGKEWNITYIDCHERSITEIVNCYKIDRFFIACGHYMNGHPEIKNLKCEVVCVIHDLYAEENCKNRIYTYIDMIQPGAESMVSDGRFGFLKGLVASILKIDKFAWNYIRCGGNRKYNKMLDVLKPVIEMYRENKNTQIIVVSEYSKHSMIYNYNVPSDDIRVLYSPERVTVGGDVRKIDLHKLHALIESGKKYYLMVSANREAKNPRKAVRAFRRFSEIHPDSYLVTIGYQEKEFPNHILLPFLSDNDLAIAFQYCYALIFPSFFEGFGYPPLEAMHFRKPVLCSNTTSMPEILGSAPIYFSPFYESAIFYALCQLNEDNYPQYSDLSAKQYSKVKMKQENDLKELVNLLVRK